ncbi:MAG: hypothetical protein ACLQBK_14870 [Candidatus Sulfotelmatobacter sp.]
MTRQEHLLMISVFSGFYEFQLSLFEAMKTAGVVDDGNLKPFHALVQAGFEHGSSGLVMRDMYRELAQKVGLQLSEIP